MGKDTTINRPESLMSNLREMLNLGSEIQIINADIKRAENESNYDDAMLKQLQRSKENIIYRFDRTRELIDTEITKVLEIKQKPHAFLVTNEDGKLKKILNTPSLAKLTIHELDFLKVLVTGEVNIISNRNGLRVAELTSRLVENNHSVTLDGNPRKDTLVMLKNLEQRGYAFRTGPSLHRVRKSLINQLKKT